MPLNISQYANAAQQLMEANRTGEMFVQREGGGVRVETPANPPSKWTQFKAALSGLPLLGQLGSLRQARAEVSAYPVKVAEQQVSSRRFLDGFAQDLRAAFGSDIADMSLRDVDRTGGTPLTARTVSTVLQNAERAQQRMQFQNNMAITRFLENPLLGGAHLPGETDMNGVFLDRNMPLNGASSWQEAIGEAPAKFVTAFVTAQCRALPEHAQVQLGNARMVASANEAFAIYQELKALPGMTEERLGGILARAAQRDSATEMRDRAREFAVVGDVEKKLDRKNPDSMLSRTAAAVAQRNGLASIPDAVLKCIERNVTEFLGNCVAAMPDQFGCAEDTASIMAALAPRLEAAITQALEAHCAALQAIGDSTVLDPAQKDMLRELAATRRLDTVQVTRYEQLATAMAEGSQGIADDLAGGHFGSAIDTLRTLLSGFEDGVEAMKIEGSTFWESGSLASGDMTMELMRQFCTLAATGASQDQAQALLGVLAGDQGHQLMQGLMMSSDMQLAGQLPLVLTHLVEALAVRAGQSPDDAQKTALGLSRQAIPEGRLPAALKAEVLTVRGTVDPGFHATMKAVIEKPLSASERALVRLPGGHMVGAQMWKDVNRSLVLMLPDGEPMVDRSNWANLSEMQRMERLEAGFVNLIALCGGNEDKARALTLVAHQGMAAGFAMACMDGRNNPLRLPDGTPVSVQEDASGRGQTGMQVTFSLGTDGNVGMHFEYQNRHPGAGLDPNTGRMLWLDRESSYVAYGYDAKVADDGHVVMSGRAQYEVNLSQSGWPRDYPEPSDDDLRRAGSPASGDLHAFAAAQNREQGLLALDAIHDFRAHPTLDRALAIQRQFLAPGASLRVEVSEAARAPINAMLERAFSPLLREFAGAGREVDYLIGQNFYRGADFAQVPGWPAGYQAPATYEALLAEGNADAILAFNSYVAGPDRAPELVAFKYALDAFQANPSLDGARGLFDEFIRPDSDQQINTGGQRVASIARALEGAAAPVDAALCNALLDDLAGQLGAVLLPQFVAAAKAGQI